MSPENTQKLFDAFPRLFRGRDLPPSESSMCWGFDLGDGWFDLVWNLSQAIEEEARRNGIDPQSDDWPEATQVKNKFGQLRFYLRRDTEATQALREEACKASRLIRHDPNAPKSKSRYAQEKY